MSVYHLLILLLHSHCPWQPRNVLVCCDFWSTSSEMLWSSWRKQGTSVVHFHTWQQQDFQTSNPLFAAVLNLIPYSCTSTLTFRLDAIKIFIVFPQMFTFSTVQNLYSCSWKPHAKFCGIMFKCLYNWCCYWKQELVYRLQLHSESDWAVNYFCDAFSQREM